MINSHFPGTVETCLRHICGCADCERMRALCPRPPLYGQVQSPDPTRYRIPVGIDMDFPPDVDLVSGIIRDIEKGAQS